MGSAQGSDSVVPPSPPANGERLTCREVSLALSRELPPSMLGTKIVGGKKIEYFPWHRAPQILDKYCPGWGWKIHQMKVVGDRLVLLGRLTIPAADGVMERDATGTEELTKISYGDPSSNAESMAFRRACAKFGLALHLYEKE